MKIVTQIAPNSLASREVSEEMKNYTASLASSSTTAANDPSVISSSMNTDTTTKMKTLSEDQEELFMKMGELSLNNGNSSTFLDDSEETMRKLISNLENDLINRNDVNNMGNNKQVETPDLNNREHNKQAESSNNNQYSPPIDGTNQDLYHALLELGIS